MTALKDDEQKLEFEYEDGNKTVFTYEKRDKLLYDLKNYFPSLFPQYKHLFKEMLENLLGIYILSSYFS